MTRPLTPVELAAVARAGRRLLKPTRDIRWDGDTRYAAAEALAVLTTVTEAGPPDPPIAARLVQPAWNDDSIALPVLTSRPLLGLMEERA